MRDYLIRQTQAAQARADAPCSQCEHPRREHRELPRETLEIVDGALQRTPNPEHQPLHFHCEHDGCDCVIVLS